MDVGWTAYAGSFPWNARSSEISRLLQWHRRGDRRGKAGGLGWGRCSVRIVGCTPMISGRITPSAESLLLVSGFLDETCLSPIIPRGGFCQFFGKPISPSIPGLLIRLEDPLTVHHSNDLY